MGWHRIPSLLYFLFFLHSHLPFAAPLCPPNQRDALINFENSFILHIKVECLRYCSVYDRDCSKFTAWEKSIDCCSWNGVTCDNVTGNAIGLDLTCYLFRDALYSNGSLLLPKLQELRMSGCNLTKFPYFLNSLERLTYLDLSSNMINGEIPRWFWGISQDTLEHLDLSHNLLEGGIQQLYWKQLSYIDLQSNSFQGSLPIPSPSTRDFRANDNNFTGEIRSSICQLSSLLELDLSNNKISGNMPPCFGNITKLLSLDLSNNNLLGIIPHSFGNITKLSSLDLSNNSLLGIIPHSFGNIINLKHLDLSRNRLQGPLPRSLVKCANLSKLVLSHNEFNDVFPHWLQAPQLNSLDLRSNRFHGMINLSAFELSFPALSDLRISNNSFTGQWPSKVFSNTSLVVIDLSNNNFGGQIPLPSPFTMYYSIASNNITGKIPFLICNATNLEMIDLSDNSLTGSLHQCLTNLSTDLSVLNLGMNQLEGTIPQSISLDGLTTLDLSQNRFEGILPRSLVNYKSLEILDLSSNQIEDTFPIWLGKLPELKILILRSNNFKGLLDIPKGDLLFRKLRILDLSNNNFGGPLPANMIMNLEGMVNAKTSQGAWSCHRIHQRYCLPLANASPGTKASPTANPSPHTEPTQGTSSLYMTLPFLMVPYENSVTVTMKGKETKLVKILTIFTTIDLSHNSFEGNIPRVIGHLSSLKGLNLSHNHLTGFIPLTLENLTNLEWLDLSSNMLSGVIPRKLGDLASLGYLNLSKNQLTGRIPQDKQLITFSNDSFSENPGLCGTPLSKSCPGDAQPPPPSPLSTFNPEVHQSWFKQKVVWLGYASGIVIGISITYIAFEIGRPKWLVQLARMLERRAAEWMEKPKRKAIKFHGQ